MLKKTLLVTVVAACVMLLIVYYVSSKQFSWTSSFGQQRIMSSLYPLPAKSSHRLQTHSIDVSLPQGGQTVNKNPISGTRSNSAKSEVSFFHNQNDSKFDHNLTASLTYSNIHPNNIKRLREHDIAELGIILEQKLKAATVREQRFKPTCNSNLTRGNSCPQNQCLRTSLPQEPVKRVSQLVKPDRLQLTDQQQNILRDMALEVDRFYDIILVTAASSNHYMESQALLRNIHTYLFPFLKNFTLLYYNLGLTDQEREMVAKYCKCQVHDFPFEKVPQFIRQLNCFAWKAILIKACLRKGKVVMWLDASIRFRELKTEIYDLIDKTKRRGLITLGGSAESAVRTDRAMYRFFGDEPCAYLHLSMVKAGFGMYHKELFVDRAILEPWVACSFHQNCICPANVQRRCREGILIESRLRNGSGPIVYGVCHRFDQSALSIILHKLYQEKCGYIFVNDKTFLRIARKEIYNYFPVGNITKG